MRFFKSTAFVRAVLESTDVAAGAVTAAATKARDYLERFLADSLATNGKVTADAKTTRAINESRSFWQVMIAATRALGLGESPSDAVALVWDFKRVTGRSAGRDYLAAKAQVKLAQIVAHVVNGDRAGFIAANYFTTAMVLLGELLDTDVIANDDIYSVYTSRFATVKQRFEKRVTDSEAREALASLARDYSPATASTQRSSSANALQALGVVTNDTRARCVRIHRDSAAYQRIAAIMLDD